MGKRKFYLCCQTIIYLSLLGSCQVIKPSSKYGLSEDYYRSRLNHKKSKKVYVVPEEDSIKVYSYKRVQEGWVDTTTSLKIAFPSHQKPADFNSYLFRHNSFDVDVLSILVKYRPAISHFPNQFNTSILNGALYLGYRSDIYKLKYTQNPLKIYNRSVSHFGLSIGAFTGFGASHIDEFVTHNGVDIQYDGFVNVAGIAGIIGIDKLSFGLLVGADHLLDKNHSVWIYQGKPWIGLSVGLNLN